MKSYHDGPLRQANELCVQCGICCVVLRASCTKEEADIICPENPSLFAEPNPEQKEGPLLIKFPCRYLRGRAMRSCFCTIYGKVRPKVCVGYYCRVAALYRQHELDLEQALGQLRKAYETRDASLFNWGGDELDALVARRQAAWELADELRKENVDEALIDYRIAASLSPDYQFRSTPHRDLFFSHFVCFDHLQRRAAVDLDEAIQETIYLFYGDEGEAMDKTEKAIKSEAIWRVLRDLREFFIIDKDKKE